MVKQMLCAKTNRPAGAFIMDWRMFFSGWRMMMYSFGVNMHAIVTVADRLREESETW